ncbi:unnamed protein product [Sphenostylis stenocarpa]|uniref:Uncharacterized protein n=1 Tax=Sphenostylis stenocarpa TaxID=92480 RepID=A0AA86VHK7_9FABA|nr:unnamed protein product [Sphenostylis stenocarpa]
MPWHSCSHTLFCGSIKLWEDTDRVNKELTYLQLQILPKAFIQFKALTFQIYTLLCDQNSQMQHCERINLYQLGRFVTMIDTPTTWLLFPESNRSEAYSGENSIDFQIRMLNWVSLALYNNAVCNTDSDLDKVCDHVTFLELLGLKIQEVERYKMHKKFKKAVEKHDQDLREKLRSDLTPHLGDELSCGGSKSTSSKSYNEKKGGGGGVVEI